MRKKGRYTDGRGRYVIEQIHKGHSLKEISVPKPDILFEILTKLKEEKYSKRNST